MISQQTEHEMEFPLNSCVKRVYKNLNNESLMFELCNVNVIGKSRQGSMKFNPNNFFWQFLKSIPRTEKWKDHKVGPKSNKTDSFSFQVGDPDRKLADQYWPWTLLKTFSSCLSHKVHIQLNYFGLLLEYLVKWLKKMEHKIKFCVKQCDKTFKKLTQVHVLSLAQVFKRHKLLLDDSETVEHKPKFWKS